jgi:hypothetical protein
VSAGSIVAVAAAVIVAMLAGAFAVLAVVLARALHELRDVLDDFAHDAAGLVDELRATSRHAAAQVERVDRLVAAAEGIEQRVDGAARLAQRTFQNPVVKAMALGAGVTRAGERLRAGADTGSGRRRGRRRAS